MDFSGLVAFAIALVVAAIFALLARRAGKPRNRILAFTMSLALCLLLMRPWEALYPGKWDAGIFIVVFLSAWTAIGTFFGDRLVSRSVGN